MKKEEKKESKVAVRRVLQYFWKKSMRYPGMFFVLVGTRLSALTIGLVVPMYFRDLIDTIASFSGGDKGPVVEVLLGIFVVMVVLEALNWLSRRIFEIAIVPFELRSMKHIFMETFAYLHKHSYRFFADSFSGALVKKVNKLVYSFESIIDNVFFNLLPVLFSVVFVIAVIFYENTGLGIVFLVRLVIYCVLQYFLYKWKLPYDVAASREDSKVTGALADSITNNFTIATFASYKREYRLFDSVTDVWYKLSSKAWRKSNIIYGSSGALMIAFFAVVIYMAIRLWGADMISVGTIIWLQIYMFRIFDQIFGIGNIFKRLYKTISESSEMIEILDQEHEIKDKENCEILEVPKGQIELRDLSFAYDKQWVFEGLNLDIKSGEKVALVGHSGSGKSTFVKLLFRFFDVQNGGIYIDGQNIADVSQESLRSHISMVPQDPLLFHRSLRDNIAYGKSDASMDEIVRAAKMAHCHEFIQDLEYGYDTLVGERGIKLSGGQRQRVAIARAILEDKKILVLDEATSSLDSESEKLIQDALHTAIQHKTAVVIAHRLSTVMEMDRIIVFDDGKVVEQGTHQELLAKKRGHYKKLRDIQSGGFIE